MCRSIKTLYNFEPPADDEEVRAAALQYVRKVSGFAQPSQANKLVFDRAVRKVAEVTHVLLAGLETHAPLRSRDQEAAKAHAKALKRFGANTDTPAM
jgi:hypothetical protein